MTLIGRMIADSTTCWFRSGGFQPPWSQITQIYGGRKPPLRRRHL